jgi:transcriptional regulator of aromatic amino acid metabolism
MGGQEKEMGGQVRMDENGARHLVKATQSRSGMLASEEDISLAALVDVPVLITGPAAACRELACELDRRSTSPVGAVEVIDCLRENALGALEPEKDTTSNAAKILLLQEVHALSPRDQLRLARELDHLGRATSVGKRILASSSIPLFDRVVDQLFDEDLYYRLNVIHIVIHPNR